jgi:hypothetical protein
MGAPTHSETLEIPAKKGIAMGADNRQNVQKQRDFRAKMVFSKNGGWAPKDEKCDFPREK